MYIWVQKPPGAWVWLTNRLREPLLTNNTLLGMAIFRVIPFFHRVAIASSSSIMSDRPNLPCVIAHSSYPGYPEEVLHSPRPMNKANLLTAVGCSGSLAAALLFGQPALASLESTQTAQDTLTGNEPSVIAPTQTHHGDLGIATLGFTSDDSLRDALGCGCALCNTNRDRATTPPIQ